jgi:hypothetical protein
MMVPGAGPRRRPVSRRCLGAERDEDDAWLSVGFASLPRRHDSSRTVGEVGGSFIAVEQAWERHGDDRQVPPRQPQSRAVPSRSTRLQ